MLLTRSELLALIDCLAERAAATLHCNVSWPQREPIRHSSAQALTMAHGVRLAG